MEDLVALQSLVFFTRMVNSCCYLVSLVFVQWIKIKTKINKQGLWLWGWRFTMELFLPWSLLHIHGLRYITNCFFFFFEKGYITNCCTYFIIWLKLQLPASSFSSCVSDFKYNIFGSACWNWLLLLKNS